MQQEADIEEQAIYICAEEELLKCRWCAGFKGSQEARVINQHINKSKTHQLRRQHHLHQDQLRDPLQGERDICTYFDV